MWIEEAILRQSLHDGEVNDPFTKTEQGILQHRPA